jgi:hypothetical protein
MKHSILFIAVMTLVLISCKKENGRTIDANYKPDVSAAKFTNSTNVTNVYFPAPLGKKYIYEGQTDEGLERVEEQRTTTTKMIMGIECIVVEYNAYLNGVLIEKTFDWYAQDNDGNVWYFGETVDNYNTNGTLKDHEGSWEAGVDGAQPGIMMPANPQVGMTYREEYYFNVAEDRAEITGTGQTVTIPYGTFTSCVKTRNWTELEPDVTEYKFYAPGIGLLIEENSTDQYEIRLIDIQ